MTVLHLFSFCILLIAYYFAFNIIKIDDLTDTFLQVGVLKQKAKCWTSEELFLLHSKNKVNTHSICQAVNATDTCHL